MTRVPQHIDCGLPGDWLYRNYPRTAVAGVFALLTTPLWLRIVLMAWSNWSQQ